MRVSWQITGIRRDAWANAHRIPVEEQKPDFERGFYLHPELFGAPREKGVDQAIKRESKPSTRDVSQADSASSRAHSGVE